MTTIKFTGTFDRYTSIDGDPYYVFKTEDHRYLVSCIEQSELVSKLSPSDLVNIEADVLDEEEQSSEGIKLVNVRF